MPFPEPHRETRVFIKFECPLHGQKSRLGYYNERRELDSPRVYAGTPYHGLYGYALPKWSIFFRLLVSKRVGISQTEVYERVRENLSLR